MKPFSLKGFLNSILNARVSTGPMGSNSFPSGHTDFDSGHPSLVKDLPKRVLVVEMPLAPLRPKIIEKEAMENIQGLFDVGEATNMVTLKSGGFIFAFENGLAQQNEKPSWGDIPNRRPVHPNPLEGLPCALGGGAI